MISGQKGGVEEVADQTASMLLAQSATAQHENRLEDKLLHFTKVPAAIRCGDGKVEKPRHSGVLGLESAG